MSVWSSLENDAKEERAILTWALTLLYRCRSGADKKTQEDIVKLEERAACFFSSDHRFRIGCAAFDLNELSTARRK